MCQLGLFSFFSAPFSHSLHLAISASGAKYYCRTWFLLINFRSLLDSSDALILIYNWNSFFVFLSQPHAEPVDRYSSLRHLHHPERSKNKRQEATKRTQNAPNSFFFPPRHLARGTDESCPLCHVSPDDLRHRRRWGKGEKRRKKEVEQLHQREERSCAPA